MARENIAVTLFPPYRSVVSPAWVRQVVRRALDVAGSHRSVEVGVVVADDETVRRLNGVYRALDEVTDVLAFPFSSTEGQEPFVNPPDAAEPLGEVVLSYPQVVRQSGEQGVPVVREMALVIVHGVLHLLGHDHADPEEEQAMKAMENRALARIA